MENNESTANYIAMFSIHSDPLTSLGAQESGGQNMYIRALVSQLDKIGWKIDVFTRWDDSHKKRVAFIGKRSRVIRLKGGPPKYTPRTQLHHFFQEIYDNFLRFIKHKNPYQIFHGHYWDGGWLALKSCQAFSRPFIQNFHSLGKVRFQARQRYLTDQNEREAFEQRLIAEKEIINQSSLIISLSESEKKDLNLLYGAPLEKIKVIPGGVNLKQFHFYPQEKAREILNIEKDKFIVLFIGRLEWRKGMETLISSLRLLREKIPNIRALIVGGRIYGRQKNPDDYKEYKRLMEKAKEEKVEDIIHFTGRINNGRLPFFYSASDVFAIPSYYEPFGLVALEAMACKAPIVASRVGGLATTIEDGETGLLFEPHNARDLKDKILQLYNSSELAERIIKNAHSNVFQNYSWGKIAKKVSEIYKKFIPDENCYLSTI